MAIKWQKNDNKEHLEKHTFACILVGFTYDAFIITVIIIVWIRGVRYVIWVIVYHTHYIICCNTTNYFLKASINSRHYHETCFTHTGLDNTPRHNTWDMMYMVSHTHTHTQTETDKGLTSHQTHYRSYRDGILRVKWPNQQCQSINKLSHHHHHKHLICNPNELASN